MSKLKKGIPSFITSLGLLCGCISIVITTTRGDLNLAGYFILAAAVFDFLDGMAARIFKVISEFGKQLDSLADVISFGVAPAMIMYRLILLSYVGSSPESDFDVIHPPAGISVILYSSFLIAVFSALRLAKFNTDTEQVKVFKGLATPANALLIAALGFISESSRVFPLEGIIFNRYFLLGMTIISCTLLVSTVRMFSFKFSSFGFRENSVRYVFLLFAAALLLGYGLPGFAPVIILYIILSLVNNWFIRMV